jgi:hypothetical protein
MKKLTLTLLTILTLTLTACGSAANGTDPASVPQNGAPAGELPVATQLILGTLTLEETENAVTPEQAAQLLPLWQTLQVLSESDTAADQETEALVTQIQETMTAGQMQAITDMNLTREDMMSIMQEQGLAMGGAPAGGQSNNPQGGNPNGGGFGSDEFPSGAPPQGGFPGGGPGGGGPGGGGGQGSGLTPDQIATAQARRAENGGDGFGDLSTTPAPLIQAMIQWLQEKAGS